MDYMIKYDIPGRETLEISHIVFDFNGTLAVGGNLIEGVAQRINHLSQKAKIYIITADTHGTVREACRGLEAEVLTFPQENAGLEKKKIVDGIGAANTLCVGNGFNDIPMFKIAALSLAVIEGEGASSQALMTAEIVCRSIIEAMDLILDSDRMKATLRN